MAAMPCKEIRDSLSPPSPAAALYVHVPFCRRKCRYCDFYSLPCEASAEDRYVRAVLGELSGRAGALRTPLDTAYVGGGTPTALEAPLLRRLLEAVRDLAGPRTEFTVEANPGTVDGGRAAVLAECGANRVALGAQSFVPEELLALGRIHTPDDVPAAVASLRSAGIANLGLDLIYGIPGQTLGSWRRSLDSVLSLRPEHLSVYALAFEEGTPLWEDLQRGAVAPMEESLQKECYFAAIEAAEGAGLGHYEISNFARPGRRCEHNLTYWHNRPYLGVGPAAASYTLGVRRTNSPDLPAWAAAIGAGREAPAAREQLPGRMAMAETLMLGLRLVEGIDRRELERRFGADAMDAFPRSLRRHAELGTLVVTEDRLRIPPEALFISDAVLADIIAEGEG
jgi:oxygen-independent coproporphyrinogen-3 oxidase